MIKRMDERKVITVKMHGVILKAVIKERNRIKQVQREVANKFSRFLPFQFLKPKSIDFKVKNKMESNSNFFITSGKSSSIFNKDKLRRFKSKSKRFESSIFN